MRKQEMTEMMDSLCQFRIRCKGMKGQAVKEQSYPMNNKDQRLQIIYKKEKKERSQLKIL